MTLPKNNKKYVYDLVVKGIPLKEIADIHNVSYDEAWGAFIDSIGFNSMYNIHDELVDSKGEYDIEIYEKILTQLN